MSELPETRALLALHLVPDLGPRLTAALLEHFGCATAAVQASASQLSQVPHISDRLADKLCTALRRVNVDEELDLLAKHQTHLRVLGTPEYPPALATIATAPHLLYARGHVEARDGNAVSLVGSRDCTTYGKRVAEQLARALARAGWTVISGLPHGTTLDTLLTIVFGPEVAQASKAAMAFPRLRGEGGKFIERPDDDSGVTC